MNQACDVNVVNIPGADRPVRLLGRIYALAEEYLKLQNEGVPPYIQKIEDQLNYDVKKQQCRGVVVIRFPTSRATVVYGTRSGELKKQPILDLGSLKIVRGYDEIPLSFEGPPPRRGRCSRRSQER